MAETSSTLKAVVIPLVAVTVIAGAMAFVAYNFFLIPQQAEHETATRDLDENTRINTRRRTENKEYDDDAKNWVKIVNNREILEAGFLPPAEKEAIEKLNELTRAIPDLAQDIGRKYGVECNIARSERGDRIEELNGRKVLVYQLHGRTSIEALTEICSLIENQDAISKNFKPVRTELRRAKIDGGGTGSKVHKFEIEYYFPMQVAVDRLAPPAAAAAAPATAGAPAPAPQGGKK